MHVKENTDFGHLKKFIEHQRKGWKRKGKFQ